MSIFEYCPGSKQIKTPYPEEIKCFCGEAVEIWSDETSAVCKKCKRKVTRHMKYCCLDWCSMASLCIGKEKYEQYLKNRKTKKGDY